MQQQAPPAGWTQPTLVVMRYSLPQPTLGIILPAGSNIGTPHHTTQSVQYSDSDVALLWQRAECIKHVNVLVVKY